MADAGDVDINEEDDDVLLSFISSHLRTAGHEMLRGADAQQTDDTEHIYSSITGRTVLLSNTLQSPDDVKARENGDSVLPSHFSRVARDISLGANEIVISQQVNDAQQKCSARSNLAQSDNRVDLGCRLVVDAEDGDVGDDELPNVGQEMSGGVDELVKVRQIDHTQRVCSSSTSGKVRRPSAPYKTRTAEKSHECDLCHKRFRYPSCLNRHTYIHSCIKRFTCEICDKTFRKFSCLTKHKLIHTAEKSRECGACHPTVNLSHDTRIPGCVLPVPSSAKQYVCDVCCKTFSRPVRLAKHKAIHADVKRFACDVCGRAFSQRIHLTVHRLTHTTTEESHECDVCHETFTSQDYLTKHKAFHSASKRFMCGVCKNEFSDWKSVSTHKCVQATNKANTCDDSGHKEIDRYKKMYICKLVARSSRIDCSVRPHTLVSEDAVINEEDDDVLTSFISSQLRNASNGARCQI